MWLLSKDVASLQWNILLGIDRCLLYVLKCLHHCRDVAPSSCLLLLKGSSCSEMGLQALAWTLALSLEGPDDCMLSKTRAWLYM